MACCYIAASMIAFILRACDALDINLEIQYNDSFDPSLKSDFGPVGEEKANSTPSPDNATTIAISGMTCSACTGSVEEALRKVRGVQELTVSLPLQEARVFHEPSTIPKELVNAIESAGFEAEVGERTSQQKIDSMQGRNELEGLRQSLTQMAFGSSVIFTLGIGAEYLGFLPILDFPGMALSRQIVLFATTVALCLTSGGWIFSSAFDALKAWRLNMHSLITVSSILGITMTVLNSVRDDFEQPKTYYDTIIGVIFIVTAGRYCDLLSRRQASTTFVGLYSMLQESAVLQIQGRKRHVQASMLRSGDEIVIEPYALIPCDGYIVDGTSYLNESVMTGESMPITKGVGDFLYAGSRNGSGILKVVVNQDDGGSFLNRLVKAVENSLVSKVSLQQSIDIITNYFVLVIFAIALGVAGNTWMHASNMNSIARIDVVGQKVMTILAAACPCALGLATPCAVMAGIDVAWRKGILIMDGGRTMEALQKVKHIVMDKTGTLTQGFLRVSEVRYSKSWEHNEKELAVLICAAEEHGASSHPVGAAVFRSFLQVANSAWKDFKSSSMIENLEEIPGHGVRCTVKSQDGKAQRVVVGSRTLMAEHAKSRTIGLDQDDTDEGLFVFVVVDGDLAAVIVLQDTPRPDAKATVDQLKDRGYRVSMLTGDNAKEASRISKHLGVEVMAASATPEAKSKYIADLQTQGHRVAMIGDGMNDGPSLAASDVGIMMAHGTKCLSTGGKVLILNSQLRSLTTLLDIAKTTTRQIRFNVGWALSYNVVAVSLAVGVASPYGVQITPPIAAAMMSMSSVSVTGLGLLLRRRLLKQTLDE